MKSEHRIVLISSALIVVLGFAAYGNSLDGEFIWDDEFLIQENSYIKSWSNLPQLFTRNIAAGAGRKWNFYRPLQMLTYMMDYSLWRLNAGGYHLTNTLLHILTALSLCWLINLLFADRLLSFLAAGLFVGHPIHAEAVSYVSGRSDSLAALFILLAFLFYIKNLNTKKISFSILALISYVLALLSRENSLIFPLLLLPYHYTFKRKIEFRKFLPLLSAAFIYILLRLTLLRDLFSSISFQWTLLQRMPGFFAALTGYARLILLPFNLHAEYGNRLFDFTDPRAITGILLLSGLLILLYKERNRSPLIFFSLSWFLAALLPVSNLYPINAYMAEHWLYLPSIGFFLILAKGLRYLYTEKKLKISGAILTIGLLAFYSSSTIKQNTYWKKPLIFYERTIRFTPGSARMYNNLALIYSDLGRHEEAIASYRKAIEIEPDLAVAYYNLSRTYRNLGRYEDALASSRKAVEISPDFAEAYNSLGLAYMSLGKPEKAMASYRKAIEINPGTARSYLHLGNAYKAVGESKSALGAYKRAVEIDPDFVEGHNSLGIACFETGEIEAAIAAYKKAIEIDPDYGPAHNNLAVTYHKEGRYELSLKYCEKAIELGYKVDPAFLRLINQIRKETPSAE